MNQKDREQLEKIMYKKENRDFRLFIYHKEQKLEDLFNKL